MEQKTAHSYPAGCYFETLSDIAGKRVTVMGLGLNGGGEACVRFLLRHGAEVTVTDMKDEAELAPTLGRLRSDTRLGFSRVKLVLGRHDTADFSSADCVIKNPGIRYEGNGFLAAARAVETDLSIFLHFCRSPIIAVTGSKGKSSTVSAIHHGLRQAGVNAFLGGNITVSPLTFLDETDESTPVVLELSSWQLRDLRGRGVLKPKIALLTKIVADHQNWYHGMAAYVADKELVFAAQTESDYTIAGSGADAAGDFSVPHGCADWGDVFAAHTHGTVLRTATQPLAPAESGAWLDGAAGFARVAADEPAEQVLGALRVPGEHNRLNALNAALALRLMGVPSQKIHAVMAEWPGIEHRLEAFYRTERCAFYNDSAATVPEAAAAASQAFGEPVTLLCGGTDKDLDFAPMAAALSGADGNIAPKRLYALAGTGTEKLLALLRKYGTVCNGPYNSLQELLSAVKADGVTGTIVFSPGCTSFGMFKNEFDRGNQFKQAVRGLF